MGNGRGLSLVIVRQIRASNAPVYTRRIACHYYRTLVLCPDISSTNLLLQSIKFRSRKELSQRDFKAIT